MSFVKIVKDGCRPMKVPAKSIPKYEACGWKVSGKKSKPVVEYEVETKTETEDTETEDTETEDAEEEDEVENESHKSVDDMSMEELQDKAKELGVNTKNLTTVGALKKAVKRAMAND